MLKLVEIINTMPKRVCRVVLFAESKDDINQKALEEFQTKAGFTVAGGSFIYTSDKEISVTAADGRLLPLGDDNTNLKYWLTHTEFDSVGTKKVSLSEFLDGSLTEEEQKQALQNLVTACTGITNSVFTTEEVIQKFHNGDYDRYEWNSETQQEVRVPATESDSVPGDYFIPDQKYTTLEVTEYDDYGSIVLRDHEFGRRDGWRIENEAPDNVPTTFGDLISGTNIKFWYVGGNTK